jgi:hypothetical protein
MRKTMAAVLVFGLVWIGYLAWPLYDLLVLLHSRALRKIAPSPDLCESDA